MPISTAKTQNVVWAALALMVRIFALKKKTMPSGASITTHISGVPKIASLRTGVFATP